MKRLCARWFPQFLTVDKKTHSNACLDRFIQNKMVSIGRFLTVDKVWVCYYASEQKNSQNCTKKRKDDSINGENYDNDSSAMTKVS